jgi:gamma-glutamyltranspeptidase/glutathione hydrolase
MLAGSAALAIPVRMAGKMTEATEVILSRGALASEPEDAVRAGARIFIEGGNAFDAAAASMLVTTVLGQELCGAGGYVACGVVLEGRTGKTWSIDSNSVAPAAARPDMYQVLPKIADAAGINENEYEVSVKNNANVFGPLAVGVPGNLAGIGILREKWGKLKWSQVLAPAGTVRQELEDSLSL